MRSKEDYYQLIKEIRKVAQNPDNLKCSCPKVECEWHDNCQQCVAIHRYYKDHVPNCFQQFMQEKVKAVVDLVEMTATEKEITPADYWEYVREQDKLNK
jgi:hypothetical protein